MKAAADWRAFVLKRIYNNNLINARDEAPLFSKSLGELELPVCPRSLSLPAPYGPDLIISNNSAACGDVLVAKQLIILIKIYFNAIE